MRLSPEVIFNRYKGALVGVHVGDSLGAPYETWKPKAIAEDIAQRGFVFFDYPNPWAKDGNGAILPAGRPTDDSDQTADLAWSLLECDGLDPTHLREALRNSVFGNVSRLWSGKATGSGGTTRDALSDDFERNQRAATNPIGTNGSLMRCAPMALWCAPLMYNLENHAMLSMDDLLKARFMTHIMSGVTHANQTSKDACWIYTSVLSGLLVRHGINFNYYDAAIDDWFLADNPLYNRIKFSLRDPHLIPYDPGDWPARGAAEFSLYVALYALQKARTFVDGIEIAVRVGGDTDTYAAIAGGLLGAKFGYEAIPKDWRQAILGHDQMVSYAAEIFNRRVLRV